MGGAPLRHRLPGVVLLAALAVGAEILATHVSGVNALLVAVGAGALVANSVGTPEWARPGIALHKLLLETGIVLLGARLTLGQLVDAGPPIVLLAIGVVAFGVVFVELLCRWAGLRRQAGSLIAAGSSVCGVSAVVAVAGSIDADETDIAYAVATVLLFDALTLVAFPVVGELLGLSGRVFGVWAGLTMFSTGPVAAAGFAHSPVAGQWATVTKLVRNALIGAVAVSYSLFYARSRAETVSVGELWTRFPKFIVGFLAVAVLVNVVGVSSAQLASIDTSADWLFALAFVGLGFEIQVSKMRGIGLTPVAVVLAYLAVTSVLALGAVSLLL